MKKLLKALAYIASLPLHLFKSLIFFINRILAGAWLIMMHYLGILFALLSRISFQVLLLLISFVALAFNDQSADLLRAISDLDKDGYLVFYFAAIIAWAHTVWLSTRITFFTTDFSEYKFEYVTRKLKETGINIPLDKDGYPAILMEYVNWIPRVLSLLVYGIIIFAYTKVNGIARAGHYPLLALVIGFVHFSYLIYRSRILNKLSIEKFSVKEYQQEKTSMEAHTMKEVLQKPYYKLSFFLILSVIVLLIILNTFIPEFRYFIGGGIIVITAFFSYAFFGMILDWKFNQWKFSAIIGLTMLFLVSSISNNNHRMLDSGKASYREVRERLSDRDYFRNWLVQRISDKKINDSTEYPVFLLATEGGGSRACYWTICMLNKLHADFPQLYEHTFAASGVSGGEVGLGFFYSYFGNDQQPFPADSFGLTDQHSAALREIGSQDFLSNITYAFAYPDMLQRFIPFKINSFDRAKFLSSSFLRGYNIKREERGIPLDTSFLSVWRSSNRFYKPCLLMNATHVEKGNRALFSPYRLTPAYYADVEDVFEKSGRSIPMHEVMTTCARFPVITPPGLLYAYSNVTGDQKPWGHLVDGGYFENTALLTCLQTKKMMESVIEEDSMLKKLKININIISLQLDKTDDSTHVTGSAYELAPAIAIYNVAFRWINSAGSLVHQYDGGSSEIIFRLYNSKDNSLPLGWYLSTVSQDIMKEQASHISDSLFWGKKKESNFINYKLLQKQFSKPDH